jgi:hypothetical protein
MLSAAIIGRSQRSRQNPHGQDKRISRRVEDTVFVLTCPNSSLDKYVRSSDDSNIPGRIFPTPRQRQTRILYSYGTWGAAELLFYLVRLSSFASGRTTGRSVVMRWTLIDVRTAGIVVGPAPTKALEREGGNKVMYIRRASPACQGQDIAPSAFEFAKALTDSHKLDGRNLQGTTNTGSSIIQDPRARCAPPTPTMQSELNCSNVILRDCVAYRPSFLTTLRIEVWSRTMMRDSKTNRNDGTYECRGIILTARERAMILRDEALDALPTSR